MKTFLLSIFAVAMVAAPVLGEDEDQPKKNNRNSNPPAQRQVNPAPRVVTPRVQNYVAPKPQFERRNIPAVTARTYMAPKTYTPNVQPRLRNTPQFTPVDQDAPRSTFKSDTSFANNRNWQARTRRNPNVVAPQTTTVNPNTIARNQFDRDDRRSNSNRNWSNDNNRNWQNNTSNNFTFEQARRNHHRERHDRSWWRSRYNRIVLFGGGYYYWNNNYWYPAYGYDPYYSTYSYDEPIYGYNDLPPGQVIANVQSALQEQGYYNDAVDGLIGPNTRAALSYFQRDRGLPITAAIDGPTLRALGLS
ncbi:MAG: peptidoglycan-binding protein [Verrucomicrobiota bacterium]|nr:peptidoglycan-binding protein [Verrucomicrobiota bacterium]